MKQLTLLIFLLTFTLCKSQNDNSLYKDVCDCLSRMPSEVEKADLNNMLQKCVMDGYIKYSEEVNRQVIEFLSNNPDKNKREAELNVRNELTINLVKNCPKFHEISNTFFPKQEVENKIINVIAQEICIGINELKTEKLSNSLVDPIIKSIAMKYEKEIQLTHNLENPSDIKRFANDLVYELNKQCVKYKLFGIQEEHNRN